jgi:hypothetical protein
MKFSLEHIALVIAAVLCSSQSAVAQLRDRVGWQPESFACAETSPPLVFTKQDFEKGFDRFYNFPDVNECDGYEPGVSDFWERSGSLRLTYNPAALSPMYAEVRYRERYACDEGKGMAEHSFEWSGSLQPVDEDPDGIFPAAGFDGGMEEPTRFTYQPCARDEGGPGPWMDVYLGLVYKDDATGELVRKPFVQLNGGPSGAGKVAFGPIPEEEEYEVEVAVTPAPGDGYETWRPRGNLDPSIPGNQLTVHVKVHEKDDSDVPRRASLRFAFRDVSRELGVCLNSPANGADTKPDLKLRFADESLGTPSADGTSIETNGLVKELDLIVESYDFGAWGTLRISGTDKDKKPVTVKVMGKATPDLTIPLDDDGNRIADVWEPGTAGGKPADSDDEHQEGNTNDGDGLTLYEEYRGFSEGGRWQQANPEKKDFFIRNAIGLKAEKGIELFAEAAQLEVHAGFTEHELDASRVINRHSDSGHKQHGVVLALDPNPAAKFSHGPGGPGPPGRVSQVLIAARNIASAEPVPGEMYTDADAEIAHELLHACNVKHHGESDLEEVVWSWSAHTYVRERKVDVVVLGEDGKEALKRDKPGTMTVWLGKKHGQHSGDDSCLMRYHKKWIAFEAPASFGESGKVILPTEDEHPVRYLTDGGPVGLRLCRSAMGTGVNAYDHKVTTALGVQKDWPRWGDASVGDCWGQIKVSDR